MTVTYAFDHLLGPDGWLSPGWLGVDDAGWITECAREPPTGAPPVAVAGHAIPGVPNLHSHAFQRAMAGLTERAGPGRDSFWTWRDVMYRFVAALAPEEVEAIATQLYIEMLAAGYTSVGEFHYLHHGADGTPYADVAEMSERIVAAARAVGIGLTLLPVLYMAGGFGGAPAGEGQRRFVNDVGRYLDIVDALAGRHGSDDDVALGIALHSLRAVPPEGMDEVVAAIRSRDAAAPVHIHIAEQVKEVEDCVAWSGARPVEWLLDHAEVDPRWCLVHATHLTDGEIVALARTGAVAGLCPTTEANLGDGVFPLRPYLHAGGAFGVGSDSHVSVSPVEELRWLEYGQRLTRLARNVAAPAPGASTGAALYGAACAGGARALGRGAGVLAPGRRADLVVLDAGHPLLVGRVGDRALDSYVFAGNVSPVRDVMVGGRWVVRDGRHAGEEAAAEAFATVMRRHAAR